MRDILRRLARIAAELRTLAEELEAIVSEWLPQTGLLDPSQAPPDTPPTTR